MLKPTLRKTTDTNQTIPAKSYQVRAEYNKETV